MGCTNCQQPPAITPILTVEQYGWDGYSTPDNLSPNRHYRKISFSASQSYYLKITEHVGSYVKTEETSWNYSISGYILRLADGSFEYYVTGTGSHSHTVTDTAPGGDNYSETGGGTYGSPDIYTAPAWTWSGAGGGSGTYTAILLGNNPYSPINIFTDPAIYDVTTATDSLNAFGSYDLTGTFTGWVGSESNSLSATFEDPCPLNYQIDHPPTASCYLRVWLTVDETPVEYVWEGAENGGFCLLDLTKSVNHADNRIFSEWAEIPLPSDLDDTQTLTLDKWSCLEGYEPGEGDPNNYPE